MSFDIRSAGADDLGILTDVYRRSSLSNEGDRQALVANPDALEFSDVAVAEGRTRVATTTEGHVVGFVTTIVASGAIELEDMFVDPDWMRQGAGRALVLDVVALARARGAGRVDVTANPHASDFYLAAGFVVDGQVDTRFGPAPRMHLDVRP
jgi:GNAT superfamily N-acetyltransferase